QFLRGRLDGARLATLRAFGGLQAYPSRRKNPDVVDLSTGSMGLGAVMTTFGALATRYLVDHGAARAPERFVVMVGDAELDEGNVWEALGEAALTRLGADVGGHDLASILDALDEAERERGRPAVILADTIKGWGLPSAADPLNHTMVTSPAQIAELRDAFGVAPGEEWAGFDPASAEAAYVRGLPPLWTAPRRAAAPSVPTNLDETYEGAMSTQEAFGRVLGALG